MKNTILKFAFSTMLAVLLATMTAWAQEETCMYLDANGVAQQHTATVLDAASDFGENTTLGKDYEETWYIVTGSISLDKKLRIYGDVHLVLADKAELSVNYNGGDFGCYIFSSLTLYSQSYGDNMGKMTVEGLFGFNISNALTINGGFVTAQGANNQYDIYGNFTFNGGRLVANTGLVYGNATIGYNSPNDFVKIKKVYNDYSVTIKLGRFFIANGSDIAKGTISASDFNSKFGGKELKGFLYYISSVDDLKALANFVNDGGSTEGMTFILTADIDFNPQEGDNSNLAPIGSNAEHPFKGTFDGGGHTIKGLRVHKEDYDSGLFGYNSGTVRNVILDDAKIEGMSNRGGMAGSNKGTIENCIVRNSSIYSIYGIIEGALYYGAGGLAGVNYGTLSNNLVINTTVGNANGAGVIVGDNNKDNGNTPILSNNFYYNSTVNGNPIRVGCNGDDITEDDGAVSALIIDGDSEQSLSIESGEYSKVVYLRNFTDGITTTIMLPFVFKASDFSNETFYYFDGIDTETWTATMTADNQTENLSANTPYIFTPSPETAARKYFVFNGVKIESPTAGYTEVTPWKFQGTYKYQSWNTDGNREIKNIYGFAATSSTNTDKIDIVAGEFVRAGLKARIRPTRAYLEYNGDEEYLLSKSAIELPDRIKVVFIDKETSSVIDDPAINPSDPNGDIPTPTSELNPAANVKVWSYDKTIYIASRPGTDYRIIDVNGRLLKESTTQTDRDEVRLGSRSGIVVVIIGNKAYKLNY